MKCDCETTNEVHELTCAMFDGLPMNATRTACESSDQSAGFPLSEPVGFRASAVCPTCGEMTPVWYTAFGIAKFDTHTREAN